MRRVIAISACAIFAVIGCQPAGSSDSSSAVKKDLDRTGEDLKKTRDDYAVKLRADLDHADREMEILKEKAKKAAGEAKVKIEKRIEELEPQRAEVHKRYEEVKSDSKRAWEELKSSTDSAWNKFKDSLHRAKEEFK